MNEYHPVVDAIKRVLDTANISYKTFEHEAVRTSEEAAAIRPEYTLEQGAKALIIRAKLRDVSKDEECRFFQIVVPGDQKFDPKKVRDSINAKDIRFATEEEVKEITGGVQPGGVPPFGILFGLKVLVDESLLEHNEIIFNAGDRCYSIAMKSEDYQKVVKPVVKQII
ncbi:MAG: YbaK/EbsC family protein [Patescibacteria group bacterium]